MLLFSTEYLMFCEIIHENGNIQLYINGIRQLIRLFARDENLDWKLWLVYTIILK